MARRLGTKLEKSQKLREFGWPGGTTAVSQASGLVWMNAVSPSLRFGTPAFQLFLVCMRKCLVGIAKRLEMVKVAACRDQNTLRNSRGRQCLVAL